MGCGCLKVLMRFRQSLLFSLECEQFPFFPQLSHSRSRARVRGESHPNLSSFLPLIFTFSLLPRVALRKKDDCSRSIFVSLKETKRSSARRVVAYMTDAKREEEGKKTAKRKRGRNALPSPQSCSLFYPFRSPQWRLRILGNFSHFSHT